MQTLTFTLMLCVGLAILLSGCGGAAPENAAPAPAKADAQKPTLTLEPIEGDNVPALRAALEKLRGGGRLVLKPGRYLCRVAEGGAKAGFTVSKVDGLTIDGSGATLVGEGVATMFQIYQCRNVVIRNLTIDWDPLPHTSGKIVAVNTDEKTLDIEPMFPRQPAPGRPTQAVLEYDPRQKRLATSGWEVYQTQGERSELTQALPDGRLRVFVRRDAAKLPGVGAFVVVRHQVYSYNAFTLVECEGVQFEDVTIHAAPGMGVAAQNSADITLRRVAIEPSAGGWMSTTADATHFNGCRGRITIEDSRFAGMGDDAVNIHGMYGLVTQRRDDHTLEVARARMNPYYDNKRVIWDAPRAGDVLESSAPGEPLFPGGKLTVAEATQDRVAQRTVVRFVEPLPEGVGVDTVLTNVTAAPSARISRCTVRGNRARGFLLQSRDIVVESCLFEDVSGSGIHVCTDARHWWESLPTRDVTIRDCTFRRCNFGVARRSAALDLFADMPDGKPAPPGVHQRVKITGNTFEHNAGEAINVGSARDVAVSGNRIGEKPGVTVTSSDKVRVEGNQMPGGDAGVTLRGSTRAQDVTIRGNKP